MIQSSARGVCSQGSAVAKWAMSGVLVIDDHPIVLDRVVDYCAAGQPVWQPGD